LTERKLVTTLRKDRNREKEEMKCNK